MLDEEQDTAGPDWLAGLAAVEERLVEQANAIFTLAAEQAEPIKPNVMYYTAGSESSESSGMALLAAITANRDAAGYCLLTTRELAAKIGRSKRTANRGLVWLRASGLVEEDLVVLSGVPCRRFRVV